MNDSGKMNNFYKYTLILCVLAIFDIHVLIFSPERFVNKSFGREHEDLLNSVRLRIISVFQLDVEKLDKYGNNALFYAIYYRNDNGVDILIKKYSCNALITTKNRIEAEFEEKIAPKILVDAINDGC